MRTIKLVAFALIFSLSAIANNSPNEIKKSSKAYQELRTEISSMIQNPNLKENGISNENVLVRFKLNEEKEIEIIKIETDSDYLKRFVNKRLENKDLTVNDLSPNQTYEVTLVFELR